MTPDQSRKAADDMAAEVAALTARAAVHEMVLIYLSNIIYREMEGGAYHLNRVFAGLEEVLRQQCVAATAEDRPAAMLAFDYFQLLSQKFLTMAQTVTRQ